MTALPRAVFFGTPEFAVPSLQALAAGVCDVVAVVTQPDRPSGRSRQITAAAVKRAAAELRIQVLQPERVRAAVAAVAGLRPDVLVTAAYGNILPPEILSLANGRCLNVHASLLPRWRGAAPIQRALLAGDRETGVTLMEMVPALDAGPVIAVERVPICTTDTGGQLHDRLAQVGAGLLARTLPAYLAGSVLPVEQPEAGVTYAHRLTRADEWISWRRPLATVRDQIRALNRWPGAVTRTTDGELKVWSTVDDSAALSSGGLPLDVAVAGTVQAHAGVVRVRCADGWLALAQVQPAGKRSMSAMAWWHGTGGRCATFLDADSQAPGQDGLAADCPPAR